MKYCNYIKLDTRSKVFPEISTAVYFVKKMPTFYTGQGFISVHKEDAKPETVSEIIAVNNIKLY